MRKLFRFFTKIDVILMSVCLVLIVGQVWLDLRLPDYMAHITTLVQTPGSAMQDVLFAGGAMLACAIGSLFLAVLVGYLVARIATGHAMRVRHEVFAKTLSFSAAELGHFSTSSLITRCTNDVTQVQMFIAMGMQASVKAPIMAGWAILKIMDKSPAWTTATAVAVGCIIVLLVIIHRLVAPRFEIIQRWTDDLNRVTREQLSGLRVVRAYNAESYQEDAFEAVNAPLRHINVFVNRTFSFMFPIMQLIMQGLTLAVYWIGVYLLAHAAESARLMIFSDMVVFSVYAMQVMMAFIIVSFTMIFYPRAAVSAGRINAVLDMRSTIINGSSTTPVPNGGSAVVFDRVSFRYPEGSEDVLREVSFRVAPGERLAIIGATGSGKSTLLQLLLRFYDASAGSITIDGTPIEAFSTTALRNRIGYVPQRTFLFGGTIASNVRYGDTGREAPAETFLHRALEIAQASSFVNALPDGVDAIVAQGGTNFSGGQRQRLSIARALYRKPPLLLLDDAFSALDYQTDRLVRSGLAHDMQDVTTIIVAQRIGTVKDCEHILVLEEGQVAGLGTHTELLAHCAVYQEIAASQLSKEELARG